MKLVLNLAKESADVFSPLKCIPRGPTALFEHYDVSHYFGSTKMYADFGRNNQFIVNKKDVQGLVGRVESLTTCLLGHHENDTDEIKRTQGS